MTARILVTGASGFVGRALTAQLVAIGGYEVLAVTRSSPANPVAGVQYLPAGDLTLLTPLPATLIGVLTVVHAAARVHVLNDRSAQSLDKFEKVNVTVTLELARQVAAAGVKRFIFLSSIGVNGVETDVDAAFSEAHAAQPHNPYAHSKLKAEEGLRQIADETGLEVVIIRPPLVYGPGVRANFAALMRAVQRGWPMPLGAVHNLRSMIAIDNLLDFIITCVSHPRAANQTFLISDGQDISSPDLIRGLAREAGVAARLFRVPPWALRSAAVMLGQSDVMLRLCGSLRVDITKAKTLLGWVPPITMDEGLRRTVAAARTS